MTAEWEGRAPTVGLDRQLGQSSNFPSVLVFSSQRFFSRQALLWTGPYKAPGLSIVGRMGVCIWAHASSQWVAVRAHQGDMLPSITHQCIPSPRQERVCVDVLAHIQPPRMWASISSRTGSAATNTLPSVCGISMGKRNKPIECHAVLP